MAQLDSRPAPLVRVARRRRAVLSREWDALGAHGGSCPPPDVARHEIGAATGAGHKKSAAVIRGAFLFGFVALSFCSAYL
ncbi:hypothetical protein NH8B_4065 [Pseudogulbenkiania sp. NH8B]|nr:hypothetical protein NH8B_4065 [Pseudogulbenkiania sp. NH8B]